MKLKCQIPGCKENGEYTNIDGIVCIEHTIFITYPIHVEQVAFFGSAFDKLKLPPPEEYHRLLRKAIRGE